MEIGLVQSKSSYRSIPDHRHYRLLLTLIGDHLLPRHCLNGLNLQASLLGYSDVASPKGLAFHGHDEFQGSSDKGKFLELLQFLGNHNESINEVLQKAPKNYKLTHSDIQKDIVNAIADEISKTIIKDLDNEFFSLLVDESRDISVKEQMALVLHYVNKK
ncbi:uncharacterized protein LOC115961818 [Quercus lobata]|uniref:uncharacterized protein LOC115961818 n=1 Tax=Quercus lobata TaxID=97700 RepID=UPI0012494304|nr:uncharacterized protein LOC115961818 [Quercus lobata]